MSSKVSASCLSSSLRSAERDAGVEPLDRQPLRRRGDLLQRPQHPTGQDVRQRRRRPRRPAAARAGPGAAGGRARPGAASSWNAPSVVSTPAVRQRHGESAARRASRPAAPGRPAPATAAAAAGRRSARRRCRRASAAAAGWCAAPAHGSPEAVAGADDGVHDRRLAELLAQRHDGHPHGRGERVGELVPDPLEQLLAARRPRPRRAAAPRARRAPCGSGRGRRRARVAVRRAGSTTRPPGPCSTGGAGGVARRPSARTRATSSLKANGLPR